MPPVASVASDSAAAATAFIRNDIEYPQVWTRKNERPLGATLAPISRSEKPQLVSRHAACLHRVLRFTGGFGRPSLTATGSGESGHCRIFPFDFARLFMSRGRGRQDGRELLLRCSQMHTRDGASLLNFTPSLHSGFRFGLSRHKFATRVARKSGLQRLLGRHLRTIAARRQPRLADTTCLPKR